MEFHTGVCKLSCGPPAECYPGQGDGSSLVSVGVVLIVLDAPRLEGVDERHEHDCAYYVFQKLVLAESSMTAVMSHHKHLHQRHRRVRNSSGLPERHVIGC